MSSLGCDYMGAFGVPKISIPKLPTAEEFQAKIGIPESAPPPITTSPDTGYGGPEALLSAFSSGLQRGFTLSEMSIKLKNDGISQAAIDAALKIAKDVLPIISPLEPSPNVLEGLVTEVSNYMTTENMTIENVYKWMVEEGKLSPLWVNTAINEYKKRLTNLEDEEGISNSETKTGMGILPLIAAGIGVILLLQ